MPEGVARSRDDRAAVDKAISLLSAFGVDANTGVGVSELARRTHLSKSTAFRLLTMLERNGVVERAGSAYRLGPLIHRLGALVQSPHHDDVRDRLTPYLADLFVATHLTVQLAVLDGEHVVYLNKLEGRQRLRSPSRIGGRMPAYCTGVGKVLLAHDPDALELTLARPRPAWTRHTLTDEAALTEELRHVRRTGVAIDRGESVEGLTCIAAPVMGANGRPVAAMSISGATESFRPVALEHTLRQVCYLGSREFGARQRRAEPAIA